MIADAYREAKIFPKDEEEPVATRYPLQGCCVRLATEEDLHRVYAILAQAWKNGKILQDIGWTSLLAWVTDKYSTSWMLCVNIF
jgi:uncharacterized glyoxalase superfamily protein PhnB